MKSFRIPVFCVVGVLFLLLSEIPAADGQLRWPRPRKQEIEVRLIALAVEYPRSSFFANDEVFVARQELSKGESRFIKLVYDFLPYQSPLSDSGLNYSLVHKFNAVRETACDENLWEMRSLMQQRQPFYGNIEFFGFHKWSIGAEVWIVGNRRILYPETWGKQFQMHIADSNWPA